MKRWKPIIVLTCASLTFGCAELAAVAIEDARALHESAKSYVEATHETRREIRRVCWDMLMKEVEALENAGDFAGARELLKANYPGLVSIDVVKKALDSDQVVGDEPFGCDGLE